MIATDPTQTVTFTLPAYQKLEPPKRPTFRARFFTVRESRRMDQLDTEARASNDPEKLAEAIGVALVGWENVTDRDGKPIPFDPKAILDFLTISELWELYMELLKATSAGEADLKKSASQPLLPAEPPAKPASPAGVA